MQGLYSIEYNPAGDRKPSIIRTSASSDGRALFLIGAVACVLLHATIPGCSLAYFSPPASRFPPVERGAPPSEDRMSYHLLQSPESRHAEVDTRRLLVVLREAPAVDRHARLFETGSAGHAPAIDGRRPVVQRARRAAGAQAS